MRSKNKVNGAAASAAAARSDHHSRSGRRRGSKNTRGEKRERSVTLFAAEGSDMICRQLLGSRRHFSVVLLALLFTSAGLARGGGQRGQRRQSGRSVRCSGRSWPFSCSPSSSFAALSLILPLFICRPAPWRGCQETSFVCVGFPFRGRRQRAG